MDGRTRAEKIPLTLRKVFRSVAHMTMLSPYRRLLLRHFRKRIEVLGLSEDRFGRLAVNDGKFMGKLASPGFGVTLTNIERAAAWLSAREAAALGSAPGAGRVRRHADEDGAAAAAAAS